MAHQALVSEDIDGGEAFIDMLNDNGFHIQAAAWIYDTDLEQWKLLIASEEDYWKGAESYFKAARLLQTQGTPGNRFDMSRIKIVRPEDPVLKALTNVIHLYGGRTVGFTQTVLDGVYIDDALVYRLAA